MRYIIRDTESDTYYRGNSTIGIFSVPQYGKKTEAMKFVSREAANITAKWLDRGKQRVEVEQINK